MNRPSRKLRDNRFTEKGLQPYVIAIGQLVLAWNDFHEKLGMLFCVTMGGEWVTRWAAIWHSAGFDRPKRKMLEGAARSAPKTQNETYPRMVEDIAWILSEADKLEEARNNAVHSPLLLLGDSPLVEAAGMVGHVIPDMIFGNPRARKMAKKDLLTEFRWCRDATLVLRDFCVLLERAIATGGLSWPDRPRLPTRGLKRSRRGRRRPRATK
jgi:hypothetical protein